MWLRNLMVDSSKAQRMPQTQEPPFGASTTIQKFYAGANVFITGGTGFLGRILIEKLLRSCPDVATLYVLVRNKKGKNVHTRIEELLDDPIFERAKAECPKFRHTVVGVAGDCSLPELGLNMQDRQMIVSEVSIVFHVAATVRFDEKLKFAVSINAKAAQEVVTLCREMRHLKSAVHVSTAYSFCLNKVIEERFYPPPMEYKNLMLLSDAVPDKLLDNITPAILEKWPNTYVYTKAMAEDIVRQEAHGLPFAVFRPAIITSTYREPVQGWVNNLYGPTGAVAGAGVGLIRTVQLDKAANSNIIPVDMCANALISVCADVGLKFAKRAGNFEMEVYNYDSNTDCPITWGEYISLAKKHGMNYPTVKAVWFYSLHLVKNRALAKFLSLILHFLPALLIDGALLCVGKSPSMLKVYRRIHNSLDVVSYFATREWEYKSSKVRNICDNMSDEDKEMFFCDFRKLDWNEYFKHYFKGIRIYLIKDPLDTLDASIVRWKRLYWLHQCTKLLLVYLLFRALWYVFSGLW